MSSNAYTYDLICYYTDGKEITGGPMTVSIAPMRTKMDLRKAVIKEAEGLLRVTAPNNLTLVELWKVKKPTPKKEFRLTFKEIAGKFEDSSSILYHISAPETDDDCVADWWTLEEMKMNAGQMVHLLVMLPPTPPLTVSKPEGDWRRFIPYRSRY